MNILFIHSYVYLDSAALVANPSNYAKYLTISDLLNDPRMAEHALVLELVKEMTKTLKLLHTSDLVMVELDASSIRVRNWAQVSLFINM